MKTHLPPSLRRVLLAASLCTVTLGSSATSHAAAIAPDKTTLAVPSLIDAAYSLSEVPMSGEYTITKYVYDATAQTFSPVYYELDIKELGDITGTLSTSYFVWSDETDSALVATDEESLADVIARTNTETTAAAEKSYVGLDAPASAMLHTEEAGQEDITGDFVGNIVRALIDPDAIEGTIRVFASLFNEGDILTTTGHFVGNATLAHGNGNYTMGATGGALCNEGTMGTLYSDFIGNLASATSINHTAAKHPSDNSAASAFGGAIYNTSSISELAGDLLRNRAYASSELTNSANGAGAYGGALYNEGTIDHIRGTVSGNTATGFSSALTGFAYGGGINNTGHIKNIYGDFSDNSTSASASVQSYSAGGALNNTGTIDRLTSDFAGNEALSNMSSGTAYSLGGAVANAVGGYILSVNGTYGENSAISSNNAGIANAYGGALFNSDTIAVVTSTFLHNSSEARTASGTAVSQGGAFAHMNQLSSLYSIFEGNTAEAHATAGGSARAYGGGLFNGGTITTRIEGEYSQNSVHASSTARGTADAYGGAIYQYQASVSTIQASFESNHAEAHIDNSLAGYAYGGAIYNSESKTSTSIHATFTNNYVFATAVNSSSARAYGGALHNSESTLQSVTGSFEGNYSRADVATGSSLVYGGAIYSLDGTIDSIEANFTRNYADSNTVTGNATANGGALYMLARNETPIIRNITGTFTANYAEASNESFSFLGAMAYGGAIYAATEIGVIKADFIGNYVTASSTAGSTVEAQGGALTTDNIIAQLTGNFYGNYTSATSTSANASSIGGAIRNEGTIGIVALESSVNFTGNYSELNGVRTSSALFSNSYFSFYEGKQITATFSMNAYGEQRIIVNDGISGGTSDVDNQIINVNDGRDGKGNALDRSGTLAHSTVEFNNIVEHHTINVHGGTLELGSYAGGSITLADGKTQQVEASVADLRASSLHVMEAGTLIASASSLGSTHDSNVITNSGKITLTSGELSNDITSAGQGVIQIAQGTTINATLQMNEQSTLSDELHATNILHGVTLGTQAKILGDAANSINNAAVTLIDGTVELAGDQVQYHDALALADGATINALELLVSAEVEKLEGSFTLHITADDSASKSFFTALEEAPTAGIWWRDLNDDAVTTLSDSFELTTDLLISVNGKAFQPLQVFEHDGGLLFSVQPVPEPSTATLSLLALTALCSRRRRRA